MTGRCAPISRDAGSPASWLSPRAHVPATPADGAKGERRYDWALVASVRPKVSLLVRRSVSRPSELAFYLCHTPRPVLLSRLVQVARARRAVEERFQAAKNEAGMDHYQARRYESWYRYVTLAMLALAFLAVTRAALADDNTSLASSANEIRRMFTALCSPPPRRAARPALVTMAPTPPRTRPTLPLPTSTTTRSLSAAGVPATVRPRRGAFVTLDAGTVAAEAELIKHD